MKTKICSRCKQEKPVSDFFIRTKDENGNPISYKNVCKQCHNEREKGRYRLKKEYIESFKNKCIKCGETRTYTLDFHHVDPSQKEFTIAQLKKSKKEVIEKEINKCVVLCANCHREFHYLNSYYGISLDDYLNNNYDLSNLNIIQDYQEQLEYCKQGIENYKEMLENKKKKEEEKHLRKEAILAKRPPREKLKELIRNETFVSIGKMFDVTDNAIRRWCDSYNLPRRKKDIEQYSDEEWKNI